MSSRREHPDTSGARRARRAAPRAAASAQPAHRAARPTGAHRAARGGAARRERAEERREGRREERRERGEGRRGERRNDHRAGRGGRGNRDGTGGRGAEERPPAHFDSYLDGLFTYCLSVMCEHDAAITALGQALAVAERQRLRDRAPADPADHRPWLYALARWSCLRRLGAGPAAAERPVLSGPAADQRRRELGALSWPEAAGTAPEQREALELAVRHRLPVHEAAAVLSRSPDDTRALLSSGACEVERTRAALAVVTTGGCADVARIAADHEVRLGTVLCRELVRHVDECRVCRRAAERAMAGHGWPGTAPAGSGTLPVLTAPRAAVHAALCAALRARLLHVPRFDRRGFPVPDRDRAARRERLRSRAVTTTVVATVIAAPVLAVWAAYRGAPSAGDARDDAVAAAEAREGETPDASPYDGPERLDGDHGTTRGPGERRTDLPGAPARPGAAAQPDGSAGAGAGTGQQGAAHTPSAPPATQDPGGPVRRGPGRLTVEAGTSDGATLVTLTASGGAPVSWTVSSDAPWLHLSRTSGTLAPGESVTVRVTVDAAAEPEGAWAARLTVAPGGTVVTVEGHGRAAPTPGPSEPPPSPGPGPSDPDTPDPTPTEPPSSEAASSPEPVEP
ncbi:sigma-70 family RNA polymerase sigma factor [Streptomyces sp. TRM 70351]|uniref:BACON domain-containing protein n=1 Tax=Streptomyces sp. TRM 70351 TaxID=3116552 RepID=UPI002E7B6BD2|nr:sigma-70 family RNA polymerase sigma factor [Streptomyces sp. TRM 70351]MEE1930406.1 sigma-70 family RNA polymerase sigma factor [Streptomyces sp. TRM 70351]